ncbi:hypothetical protein PMAYCL1PPCAC_13441, partial [Pristionchus mayeri]
EGDIECDISDQKFERMQNLNLHRGMKHPGAPLVEYGDRPRQSRSDRRRGNKNREDSSDCEDSDDFESEDEEPNDSTDDDG